MITRSSNIVSRFYGHHLLRLYFIQTLLDKRAQKQKYYWILYILKIYTKNILFHNIIRKKGRYYWY